MNMLFLKEYINKLTIKQVDDFTKNNNIILNNSELNTLYYYIKNKYKLFLNDPNSILQELKEKLSSTNYLKLENFYNQYKEKIRNYFP